MATESADGLSSHVRGITVTTLACIAGIAAAVGTFVLTGGATDPAGAATDSQGLYLMLAAVVVQFPILHLIGVKFDDMSAKDYIYVLFMTFSLWFVALGIMLTAVGIQ